MATVPAWKKAIQSSLKTNIDKIGTSATYASLATVTVDNKPAVRTVVMRGFAGEHYKEETGWQSNLPVIITDKTSRKIEEIRKNPNTEINWYMNGTMEQFRIRGTIDIVDKEYSEGAHKSATSSHDSDAEIIRKLDVQLSGNTECSLPLQAFLKQQKQSSDINHFSWKAERLRQFIEFGADMRAGMVHSQQRSGEQEVTATYLEIDEIDPATGWFDTDNQYLSEAFENFVILAIKVTSVLYWSPSTGTKVIL